MDTYETSATVKDQGRLEVVGVPFAPGTQVEVSISAKRPAGEDFAATWRRVCAELRGLPTVQCLTDADIGEVIDRYRAGQ